MEGMESVFQWVGRLTLFSVLLQTLEIIKLRPFLAQGEYWDWRLLHLDLSKKQTLFKKLGDFIFTDAIMTGWLILRVVLCGIGFIYPSAWLYAFLILTNLALSLRWRGSFNGGSDAMTLHGLLCLWLAQIFQSDLELQRFVGCYLVFQVFLSYWIAGYVKLKNPDWWSGKITQVGLLGGCYPTPAGVQRWAENLALVRLISLGVLIFEILFPLALINKTYCVIFLSIGFLFHLSNALILGLNRFFWAWIATYPAIYFFA